MLRGVPIIRQFLDIKVTKYRGIFINTNIINKYHGTLGTLVH